MFLSSPSDLKVDWLTFSVTVAAGDSLFFLSVPFFNCVQLLSNNCGSRFE